VSGGGLEILDLGSQFGGIKLTQARRESRRHTRDASMDGMDHHGSLNVHPIQLSHLQYICFGHYQSAIPLRHRYEDKAKIESPSRFLFHRNRGTSLHSPGQTRQFFPIMSLWVDKVCRSALFQE
jgi:hypothetical protein